MVSGVELVTKKLIANPLIKSFSLVKRVHSVMFSKCEEGDGYGWHVDNPFSKHGRRDLSFTIFLSDLSDYQGGELSIQSSQESHDVRLPPGHIFLYPSTALHCVQKLTSGIRLVCVGWIESYVPSSEDRLLLFNLEAGARSLLARHGRSDELDLIYQSYVNAVRRLSG
jgi:PKHD-type hydroxylase